HPNIKLVRQIGRSVPFLDVLIQNSNGVLKTSVYHKEAAEPYVVPFGSDYPGHVFRNTVDTAITRAVRYSTALSEFEEKIRQIKLMFLYNGYPSRHIDWRLTTLFSTPSKDDFGYKLTDLALMYLYDQYARLPSKCDYILITNGDNLYSSFLGSKLKTHLLARKDIVAWDFISHYERVNLLQADSLEKGTNYEIFDDGTAKCLPISLIPGHFDLGAAVYRLAFLRHYALQFRYPDGSYDSWSDGYFMARASGYTNATVLIRQTLLIHQ
ncbi:unnamed protein product, partial [Rotaria socialis]